jgi:hypothetical protein
MLFEQSAEHDVVQVGKESWHAVLIRKASAVEGSAVTRFLPRRVQLQGTLSQRQPGPLQSHSSHAAPSRVDRHTHSPVLATQALHGSDGSMAEMRPQSQRRRYAGRC